VFKVTQGQNEITRTKLNIKCTVKVYTSDGTVDNLSLRVRAVVLVVVKRS